MKEAQGGLARPTDDQRHVGERDEKRSVIG
jgi:hypothetical protein